MCNPDQSICISVKELGNDRERRHYDEMTVPHNSSLNVRQDYFGAANVHL